MSNKKTWVAAVILCGAMLTGIVIGSVGTLLILKTTFQHHRPPEMGNVEMRKDPVKDFMLRRMQKKLDLDEAQTKLIKADLESMAKDLGEFHVSVREDLGKMVDEADEVIKSHLTPEQVEIFEREFVNRRRFHEHRRDGKGRDYHESHKEKTHSDGRFEPHPSPDH